MMTSTSTTLLAFNAEYAPETIKRLGTLVRSWTTFQNTAYVALACPRSLVPEFLINDPRYQVGTNI